MGNYNISSNLRANIRHGLHLNTTDECSITFRVKEVKKNFRCCMCRKSFPLNVEKQLIMTYQWVLERTISLVPFERERVLSDKKLDQIIGRVCGDNCFNAFLLAWPDIFQEIFGRSFRG